jgi:eukaryotic-like serine/threonine-protein kinase
VTTPDRTNTTPSAIAGSGRVLAGRYELGTALGSGGMATVWLAHDRVLDRDVAVKVLRGQYATDPAFLARFTREARHAASLSHPGLVTIFDTGVDHGTAFIVMEAVPGRTLREVLLTGGPLPVATAVAIAVDVCEVLDVAHRAGVVHRDIKPGNILLANDGRTRVFDFGIARADGADPLTQTAMVLGTAAYISPEQAAGQSAGPKSDLYALGCVLFEMLTGAPPFTAENPVGMLYQHVHDRPQPPSATRAEVPGALDAVVLRLLAKNPATRPATAADTRNDLLAAMRVAADHAGTRLLPTVDAVVPPSSPRRARRRWPVAALIVLALLSLLAWFGFRHHVATPAAASSPSHSAAKSPTPSPSAVQIPTPTPTPTPTVPALLVVPATTPAGALDALRSVIQAGGAANLIDPSAASQLSQATDAVQSALQRGHNKSVGAKIQDLTELLATLTSDGQVTPTAAGPLQDAVAQLSQLVSQRNQ